jgi:ABC-type transport system substrate-binding protein
MVQQMSKPDTSKHLYGVYLSYDYGDPDALLFPGWHSSGHGTWSGSQWYKNPKADELIEQGRTMLGDDKRLPIYKEIQQTILADSPSVFVFNEPVRVALNKNVGGYDYIIGVYNYSVYNLFKQA